MSGYVLVRRTEDSKEDSIELPTEEDGSLLLSVLQSQFEGASGLRYKNPSTGSWRAIKLCDGVLNAPTSSGWGEQTYYVVLGVGTKEAATSGEAPNYYPAVSQALSVGYSSDGAKRMKLEEESSSATVTPSQPTQPTTTAYGYGQPSSGAPSQDLIVLGLEWSVTTEDMKLYFEKFGEITSAEVKADPDSGRSRGFGFIRFKDPAVQERVCELNHAIKGRKVDVKHPTLTSSYPTKLFVGCLPLKPEVEKEELEAHFSEFGQLTDVYIPRPYRGFGFITFKDPVIAQRVMNVQHTLRKSQLNLSFADPKGSGGARAATRFQHPFSQPDYSAYQQQYNYGHYSQYAQQAAYQAQHPQASGAFGYDAYASGNNQQARANYARNYVDGQTQQQYSQSQAQTQRPPLPQNPSQPNPAYTQGHYQARPFHQYHDAQSNTRPQTTPSFQQGTHPPVAPRVPSQDHQHAYDPKNVWSNY